MLELKFKRDNAAAYLMMASIRDQIDAAHIAMQKECAHSALVEADYVPSTAYTHARPPIRMCTHCGMTEDGWGCGYVVLRGTNVPMVERDDIMGARLGLWIWEDIKGPLLRGENALERLIEERYS